MLHTLESIAAAGLQISRPEIKANGLVWIKRKGHWYGRWQAPSQLIKRGWRPRTQEMWSTPIAPNEEEAANIVERCEALQAQMIAWRQQIPRKSKWRRSWTEEENEIIRTTTVPEACQLLTHRSYAVIIQRRHELRHSEAVTSFGQRWTEDERRILREYYPVTEIQGIKKLLPRFTARQIQSQAHRLGIKKRYLDDTAEKIAGHIEIVDQIRMRAREDGFRLGDLDRMFKTGTYFSFNYKRCKSLNLRAVSRALSFFGGALVIDWRGSSYVAGSKGPEQRRSTSNREPVGERLLRVQASHATNA